MTPGAGTPEELESLLEDGFLLGDRRALVELFALDAVLCDGARDVKVRGSDAIAHATAALCERGFSYLASTRCLLQSGDTALMVGPRAINVIRRGPDRRWLYAISLLDIENTTERSTNDD
jgi:hypothetical protein